MIKAPIKGESLKADWAKAITDGVNAAAPVGNGRRGLVSQTPSGTGFAAVNEVSVRKDAMPLPFCVRWGAGASASEVSADDATQPDKCLQFYLPSGSLIVNNTEVDFDGTACECGGGWVYWDELELKTGAIWCVIDGSSSSMVQTIPDDKQSLPRFKVCDVEKKTAGGKDYPVITQLVYGQVMVASPILAPKIYEPTFTAGKISSVGEGAWGVARETYFDLDPSVENINNTTTGFIYLHITHPTSNVDPEAELVDEDGKAANDDENSYFPLYKINAGAIVLDLRGDPPRAQVYE